MGDSLDQPSAETYRTLHAAGWIECFGPWFEGVTWLDPQTGEKVTTTEALFRLEYRMLTQLIALAVKLEQDIAASNWSAALTDFESILGLLGTAPPTAMSAHAAHMSAMQAEIAAGRADPAKINWGGLLSKLLPILLQLFGGDLLGTTGS